MNHTIALTDERNGHTPIIYVTSDKHGDVNDILFDAFLNETWEDENGQQPANLTEDWNNNWATAEIINTTTTA